MSKYTIVTYVWVLSFSIKLLLLISFLPSFSVLVWDIVTDRLFAFLLAFAPSAGIFVASATLKVSHILDGTHLHYNQRRMIHFTRVQRVVICLTTVSLDKRKNECALALLTWLLLLGMGFHEFSGILCSCKTVFHNPFYNT